ncbi:MAG: OmpA family protein [Bacteroidota bacterium]
MTLRHLLLYLASLTLICVQSQAQTSRYPWMAGVSGTFLDYQGLQTGNLLNYKSFDPGIQFGAHVYLNKALNLSIQSAFVPETMYPLNELEQVGTSLVDVNGLLTFKTAGTLFSEEAVLAPYFSTGIGLNSANNIVRPYIPAALGLRVRISGTFSLQFETMYKQRLGKNSFQHLAHSAGFVFALPTQKKPTKPPVERKRPQRPEVAEVADRDGDGIADNDDLCPDEKGLAMYLGCPAEETKEESVPAQPAPSTSKEPVQSFAIIDEQASPEEPAEEVNEFQIEDMSQEARLSDLQINDEAESKEEIVVEESPAEPTSHEIVEIDIEDQEFLAAAINNIYFEYGSENLTVSSLGVLDTVALILKKYPEYNLQVLGHTDNTGDPTFNQILSVKRAFQVKYYLVYTKGIRLSRISSDGYNSAVPLADNTTERGRAMNRRVELKVSHSKTPSPYPN